MIVLAILMMLAGTTFAGHDWASGSVSNQLLFEPRRPLVWAAKAAVVTALAGLFAAVGRDGVLAAARAGRPLARHPGRRRRSSSTACRAGGAAPASPPARPWPATR